MPKPEKTKQVTLYLLPGLAKRVEQEGMRRRRKMGPTVIEILHDYFAQNDAKTPGPEAPK